MSFDTSVGVCPYSSCFVCKFCLTPVRYVFLLGLAETVVLIKIVRRLSKWFLSLGSHFVGDDFPLRTWLNCSLEKN